MRNIIPVLLSLVTFASSAQITLQQCQEKARANYPLIKQFELIEKSTEYTIANANKAYCPQVSVTGIGAYIIKGFPEVSLPGIEAVGQDKFQFIGIGQINQTIWDGGIVHAQKDIANASAEVEKASIEVSMYSIRERVNQLFFGILVIDEQMKQLEVARETLERNLKKISVSKENGLAYKPDVDEVQAEVLVLEQKKIEYRYARKGYVEMLSYLVGEILAEDAVLEQPVEIAVLDTLINKRPELTLFSNQRNLVAAQSGISRALNMPRFGLHGAGILIEPGISFGLSELNSLAIAGVSVSWNTAGIYRTSANKKLDKIHIDKINTQQEAFLFSSKLQQLQARSEIEKQQSILRKDDEIVALKESVKKAYELKYENGMCSLSDLLDAVNKEYHAQSNRALHHVLLLKSIYEYRIITGN